MLKRTGTHERTTKYENCNSRNCSEIHQARIVLDVKSGTMKITKAEVIEMCSYR